MNIDAVPIADRKYKEIRVKEWLRHCPQRLARTMRDEEIDEPNPNQPNQSESESSNCV